MNAPLKPPAKLSALEATCERLLSRGLAEQWIEASDRRLHGAVVTRGLQTARPLDCPGELASQLDGQSLRCKPVPLEDGLRWRVEGATRAYHLDRRRSGNAWAFRVSVAPAAAPSAVPLAGRARESFIARSLPVEREEPALDPHAGDTSAAPALRAPAAAASISAPALAKISMPAAPSPTPAAPPPPAAPLPPRPAAPPPAPPAPRPPLEAALHPRAEDTSPAPPPTAQQSLPVQGGPPAVVLAFDWAPALDRSDSDRSSAEVPAADPPPPADATRPAPLLEGDGRAADLSPGCSSAGCQAPVSAKNLCKRHYDAAWRRGRRGGVVSGQMRTTIQGEPHGGQCADEDCVQPALVRGYCKRCYNRRWTAQRRLVEEAAPTSKARLIQGTTARGREQSARAAWMLLANNPVAAPWGPTELVGEAKHIERRTVGQVPRPVIRLIARTSTAAGRWTKWEAMIWRPERGAAPQTLSGFTSRRQAECVAETEARRVGWVLV
jgi:hypothetical protein